MSEAESIKTGNENPASLPSYETDWFLQNLVRFANEWGLEMSITLQVGGMLVSGTLISGKRYFDEFATLFASGFKNDNQELGESFHKLISSYKQIYEVTPEESENSPPPAYIHLRNTLFFQPGQQVFPTSGQLLWRGRIAEVGGFHLGCLNATES